MPRTVRTTLFAALAGAGLLAGPLAFAQGSGGGGIDTDGLVRFAPQGVSIRHEEWVSTEVLSSTTLTKIGFGRMSEVVVSTTATGTYSSDALLSPHVRYPGITVTREAADPVEAPIQVFVLGDGTGWTALAVQPAASFLAVPRPMGERRVAIAVPQ